KEKKRQNAEPESSSDWKEDDWRCFSRWPEGDSVAQTRSNLRAEATEFLPRTATPDRDRRTDPVDFGCGHRERRLAGPGVEIKDAELETATNDREASPPSSHPTRQYPFRNRHAPKTF